MQPLGDPHEHIQLLSRMGQTLGLDLPTAFTEGQINSDDWAEMVLACRGCTITEQCHQWLDHMDRMEEAPTRRAPTACRNGHRLSHLHSLLQEKVS